jgi:hypothetical protein
MRDTPPSPTSEARSPVGTLAAKKTQARRVTVTDNMSAVAEPRCTVCDRPSQGRMYCSARCKQRAYRARRREEARPPLRLFASEAPVEAEDAAEVGRRVERFCVSCLLQAVEAGDVRAATFLLRARWPSKWGAR